MSLQSALSPHENSLCTFAVSVVATPVASERILSACPGYSHLLQGDVSACESKCLYCDLVTTTITPYPEITEQIARRYAALYFWENRLALQVSESRKTFGPNRKKELLRIVQSLLMANRRTGWVPDFLELTLTLVKTDQLHELWLENKRGMLLFEIERLFRPRK